MRQTLAIAEDEYDLLEVLVEFFEGAGFSVIAAADGKGLRDALVGRHVHGAILDITMPGEDGLSLAIWLRKHGPVGLVMATALGRPIDRVVGLEVGADDYVVKPYDLRELLARTKAVLRRMAEHQKAPPEGVLIGEAAVRPALIIGKLELDPSRRTLVAKDGRSVLLTQAEFQMLSLICDRQGRPVDRDALAVATGRETPGERAIDVSIARLRRKIESLDPATATLIRSVRGEGYVMDTWHDARVAKT